MKNLFVWLLMLPLIAGSLPSCELLSSDKLTDEEIANGLKEALRIGSTNSVNIASVTDGYFGDTRIRIPWPQDATVIETTLRGLGMNGLCDDLILKLNRAAEDAAERAEPIFHEAIANMTIADAFNILHGNDDAATVYLEDQTRAQLKAEFKPEIEASLQSVGAQQAWATIVDTYNNIPFVAPANSDLSDVTTDEALDGLFVLLADEELKIRTDINARVTELLQEVFGELDN